MVLGGPLVLSSSALMWFSPTAAWGGIALQVELSKCEWWDHTFLGFLALT